MLTFAAYASAHPDRLFSSLPGSRSFPRLWDKPVVVLHGDKGHSIFLLFFIFFPSLGDSLITLLGLQSRFGDNWGKTTWEFEWIAPKTGLESSRG